MGKSRVYTGTGDKGQTSLVGGQRVSKADQRIDLYGQVDELNACIGVVRAYVDDNKVNEYKFLGVIQNHLFTIGSIFASEPEDRDKFKLPQLSENDLKEIEEQIDLIDEKLEPLKNFILPTGTLASSHMHICRTVARRVERQLVSFMESHSGDIPTIIESYINRLSDYFFVLSRYDNKINGEDEVIWKV